MFNKILASLLCLFTCSAFANGDNPYLEAYGDVYWLGTSNRATYLYLQILWEWTDNNNQVHYSNVYAYTGALGIYSSMFTVPNDVKPGTAINAYFEGAPPYDASQPHRLIGSWIVHTQNGFQYDVLFVTGGGM